MIKNTNVKLLGLVDEMIAELSRFTLAGGVLALKHDDALDLLNQISEMETFAPSTSVYKEDEEEFGSSIWWGEDPFTEDKENYSNSTVF